MKHLITVAFTLAAACGMGFEASQAAIIMLVWVIIGCLAAILIRPPTINFGPVRKGEAPWDNTTVKVARCPTCGRGKGQR